MLENFDTIESVLFDCQCALFILDINDPNSIIPIEKLFEKIDFSNFPYLRKILVENKIDGKREISEETIQNFIYNNKFEKNLKISIKNQLGIEDLVKQTKEYVNRLEKEIPNNFCSQIINESNNENRNKVIKANINIIFLGNSMVGKTCLYLRLNKNFYNESFISTIGIEKISKFFKYNDDIYKVNLCDTAGQDRYRTLPKRYYKNSDGVFLMFDLCNRESFNDISVWMAELKDNYSNTNKKDNEPIIYLLGNKLDNENRVVSKEEAEDKARFYKVKYYEISCKLNLNVPEIYSRMVVECFENSGDNLGQISFSTKINKKKTKNKNADLCC